MHSICHVYLGIHDREQKMAEGFVVHLSFRV